MTVELATGEWWPAVLGDPDVVKDRLRPEDRAAPYVDVLVEGLRSDIPTDR